VVEVEGEVVVVEEKVAGSEGAEVVAVVRAALGEAGDGEVVVEEEEEDGVKVVTLEVRLSFLLRTTLRRVMKATGIRVAVTSLERALGMVIVLVSDFPAMSELKRYVLTVRCRRPMPDGNGL